MSLSLEEVRHVAALSRLKMNEDELVSMQETLSSILDHIEVLSEIDTDSIPPTAQVGELSNVWREDEVTESLPQETVLSKAAASRDGFFAVSAVMGNEDGGEA